MEMDQPENNTQNQDDEARRRIRALHGAIRGVMEVSPLVQG